MNKVDLLKIFVILCYYKLSIVQCEVFFVIPQASFNKEFTNAAIAVAGAIFPTAVPFIQIIII